MKCQSLFSGKNKKNIINLLSAEYVHRVVNAKKSVFFCFVFFTFFAFRHLPIE